MSNINYNLFKPWVSKAIPTSLITGLNGLYPSQPDPDVFSKYSTAPAKIRPIVVSALCKILNIAYRSGKDDGMDYGSLGTVNFGDNVGYAIEIAQNGHREAAIIKNNSSGIPTVYAKTDSGMYSFKENYNNGVLLMAAVLFYELMAPCNEEFNKHFIIVREEWKKGITSDNLDVFGNSVAILSENIYRRLCGTKDALKIKPLNDNGNVYQITAQLLASGKVVPEVTYGPGFKILSQSDESNKGTKEDKEVITKSARDWTDEEKLLIPTIPEWYIMPKEVKEVCKLVRASTNTFKPKRNFMFRGPSSTGKTSMARAIAAELGMPYVFITCSSDTESSAFLGEPMYDKNGNVKYVESPFIRAIKNGYVVEVQEPYTIAKQGVLTSLNGLLDDSEGVTLATGEFVKRHPDCIVIFTTNVSYVGCKKPNQSVLRRMNGVYDINMPSEAEICKRVQANTKFDDRKLLSQIVKCAHKIDKHLQEQMIDDGVCGVSEIIDWVSTVQIQNDIVESARSTIVSKATDDQLEQANILALVEAEFTGVAYTPKEVVSAATQM